MRKTTLRGVGAAIRAGEPAQNSTGTFRFDGRFAWSYAEPIAMREPDGTIVRTTAKFSVTTSKHCGQCYSNIPEGDGYRNRDIAHGELRRIVREAGLPLGPRGRKYDRGTA